MGYTDNERIAILETKLSNIEDSMKRVEKKIDNFSDLVITRKEADARFKNIEEDIEEMKQNRRSNISIVLSGIALLLTFIFNLISLLH